MLLWQPATVFCVMFIFVIVCLIWQINFLSLSLSPDYCYGLLDYWAFYSRVSNPTTLRSLISDVTKRIHQKCFTCSRVTKYTYFKSGLEFNVSHYRQHCHAFTDILLPVHYIKLHESRLVYVITI